MAHDLDNPNIIFVYISLRFILMASYCDCLINPFPHGATSPARLTCRCLPTYTSCHSLECSADL